MTRLETLYLLKDFIAELNGGPVMKDDLEWVIKDLIFDEETTGGE